MKSSTYSFELWLQIFKDYISGTFNSSGTPYFKFLIKMQELFSGKILRGLLIFLPKISFRFAK